MNWTRQSAVECVVSVRGGGQLDLTGADLRGQQNSGGVCAQEVEQMPMMAGLRVAGFARGVALRNHPAQVQLSQLTLHDNAVGLVIEGPMPTVSGNTFSSSEAQQIIAMRLSVGAEPGGEVVDNIFDLDLGDLAYHVDPDNLSTTGGTVFGPNTWMGRQPDGFLMSGQQTSPEVNVYPITELDPNLEPFLTVQVPGDIEVASGSRLRMEPNTFQIWTLQGLRQAPGETILEVNGDLILDGDGMIVSDLPIAFLAGSTGELSRISLISAREDLPMVTIVDSGPTVGGRGSVDGCSLTGSSQLNVVGMLIRADEPMCVGDAVCPFIAENQFRNLSIGIDIESGDFQGVNDFDDANPMGDSVPINVRRQ
ncbi:MAG: hypothetical protein AAFX99_36180 [Myxococcota bacterium]